MEKIKDLHNLTIEELQVKENSLQQELFNLNQQRYSGRVEKPHLFRKIKKDIARIKTILDEKKYKLNQDKVEDKNKVTLDKK